eukprot:CAMPEP_0206140442 /NCGR_PEP_ID=MMETSP1473-20131121/9492_1 /ASSEMBLY_ACC=CAM_ASM_001109 /TAXON_ID=1461547 /ORGANISM="Stichococcus sp, Strain RCC1054" /LENGTH=369 /DNA_ID=CAMNT_0053534595 /DNA_START=232 /DNA_END=1341 /DNA_ORIENTATION=+
MRRRPDSRSLGACRASSSTASEALEVAQPLQPDAFMQERMDFLREDLKHLFDEQGIDKSAYEDRVKFRDPLTKYDTVWGYTFNIQFLRRIFGPDFILHDLRQSGKYEITSRWTMSMKLTFNQISPLRKWWDPELVFTGVSIMGLNPETGKFKYHIDYWDAIKNQEYLSFEAVKHLFGQLTTLAQAPRGLEQPDYTIMRKFADCEVRRYDPFLVAETDADAATNDSKGSGGGGDGRKSAFRTLARYIFGEGNDRREKLGMSTPVFTSETGRMQFVVGKADKAVESLPKPLEEGVDLVQKPGGYFAAVTFSGMADEERAQQEAARLRAALPKHNLKPRSGQYIVARYNDPGTKPIFRRNDVLIELEDFKLW